MNCYKPKKFGYVHIYKIPFGEDDLIKIMKILLKKMSPNQLERHEMWERDGTAHLNKRPNKHDIINHLNTLINSQCCDSVFWGTPNSNSRIYGFWPNMKKINPDMPRSGIMTEEQAIKIGKCVL